MDQTARILVRATTIAAATTLFPGLLFLSSCTETDESGIVVQRLSRCEGGLRMALSGEVPDDYRITVEVPGTGGQPFQILCPMPGLCPNPLFLSAFTPKLVRVVVVAGDDSWASETAPQYEEHRPNGPDSDPACLLGTIEVPVGPGAHKNTGIQAVQSGDPDH